MDKLGSIPIAPMWRTEKRALSQFYPGSSGGLSGGSSRPNPGPSDNWGLFSSPHLNEPLMDDRTRLRELQARLASSIGGGDNLPVFLNILFKQVTLEKKIEAALVDDGYPRERVLEKRHAIRGFLFYPRGTALTERTLTQHLEQIERNGTRASVPYRRIGRAVENHDLLLFFRRVSIFLLFWAVPLLIKVPWRH